MSVGRISRSPEPGQTVSEDYWTSRGAGINIDPAIKSLGQRGAGINIDPAIKSLGQRGAGIKIDGAITPLHGAIKFVYRGIQD